MKIKHIVLATTMMVTLSTFAQKDELKALKKIYAKEVPSAADIVDYKSNISKLETSATEEGDKIYTQFYKAMMPVMEVTALGPNATSMQLAQYITPKSIAALAVGLNATLDYEKKTGKKVYTDDINETIGSYKPILVNFAYALANAKKDKEAYQVLYSIYQLDKKDVEKLYYAANYAVMAKDFDAALDYYAQLKALNYSGEGTTYSAVNKTTKAEETFNTKVERDLFIKAGSHDSPKEEKIPSKRGEIYKNIALILVQKDKIEEAKTAIADARKVDPDDTSLIVTEADLYLKLKDFDTYKKLINQALEKNPNDADLIYNLGVISAQGNNLVDAEKHYLRVIEIDPKYINAYLNLANVKLEADKPMVDEMNKLTTSDKDNKRYEVLKKNRETLFKSVLPYYEKVYELDPKTDGVVDNLLSVYNFLEMTDKYKALKAKK
jgi:tetratricopeptide (TPR) repeat protein